MDPARTRVDMGVLFFLVLLSLSAQILIAKSALSQPQADNCSQPLMVPFIEYQTLEVDTKNLRFTSQLKAVMFWTDPELAWNESEYDYDKVVLPVDKVWTPQLIVINAMSSVTTHGSKDLLVYSNGTVKHSLSINAAVDCEVNLFKYPFSYDLCPVAIEAWSWDDCGMELKLGRVYLVDGSHGDWQTDAVSLQKKGDSRNYIMVSLSNRFMNPFLSLVMPSLLIVIVDVVSFALPLGGGERNAFKVTLVLSFIMFLLILNGLLPGDSQCSPILRAHFCVCLLFLVVSMVASMLLTRVAKDDSRADAAAVAGQGGDPMQTVVRFLNTLEAERKESHKCDRKARRLDKLCFYLYLFMCVLYFVILVCMFTSYPCEIDHFLFWY
ncbi:hypothetical protein NHX12_032487 [Muraenolepis orangiensis]|uniref:Neurotransmitter-gated ion-channel ligand-binding domain-containing protein n=1 Tax=Muraenolepis orangiensis TaxID=630683 RepID=A0A9Q0E5V9_9TELE|nr:hypothetical protein NHX12_032487 [Muraenolepis orangiensis]